MMADPVALLVAGDVAAREALRAALDGHGFRVLEPEGEAAARGTLTEQAVELVAVAPNGCDSAEDLLRAVRSEPETAAVYVLVLCPRDRCADALELGADVAVPWPSTQHELDLRVAAAVRIVEMGRELRLRARQSESMTRLQTEFYSVVAHEIRTPMTAILSSAKILKRHVARDPEKVERFAGIIVEEGDRLLRLINNLLDLHRIESGRMEWRYELDDISRLIRHVADSFASMAADTGVGIAVDLPPERLELMVDGDKVIQVLGNLIGNAIKHSPAGGVVRLTADRGDGGEVEVAVEDDGPGVPDAIRPELFQRFVRGQSGGIPGTGLGLAIARELVVRHGGTIGYEPRATGGSRFAFRLPARTSAAED